MLSEHASLNMLSLSLLPFCTICLLCIALDLIEHLREMGETNALVQRHKVFLCLSICCIFILKIKLPVL